MGDTKEGRCFQDFSFASCLQEPNCSPKKLSSHLRRILSWLVATVLGKVSQMHLMVKQKQGCWAGMCRYSRSRLHPNAAACRGAQLREKEHSLHSLVSQGIPALHREGKGSVMHPLTWICLLDLTAVSWLAKQNKLLSSKNPGTRVKEYKDSQPDFPTALFFPFFFHRKSQFLERFWLE